VVGNDFFYLKATQKHLGFFNSQHMRRESITQLKHSIKATMTRLQPMKSVMREDELEDVDYYESFDITNCANKKIIASILIRLTIIETRLFKKNTSILYQ